MTQQPNALRLASALDSYATGDAYQRDIEQAAEELRRLHHNSLVLTDALWKACGDDEEVVNATIESQGELK